MTCEKRDSTAESVEDSYLFNICLDLISPAVAPHHLYASESWEELGKKIFNTNIKEGPTQEQLNRSLPGSSPRECMLAIAVSS